MSKAKLSLAEARKQGKLDQFVAEREDQPDADCEVFETTLGSMVRTSKSEPETSTPDCADD
jgi:hypothetical protein